MTSIETDSPQAEVGQKIGFYGSVKTGDGDPVPNVSLDVESSTDEKIWTRLARAHTDRRGDYAIKIAFAEHGKFWVRASFPGA